MTAEEFKEKVLEVLAERAQAQAGKHKVFQSRETWGRASEAAAVLNLVRALETT